MIVMVWIIVQEIGRNCSKYCASARRYAFKTEVLRLQISDKSCTSSPWKRYIFCKEYHFEMEYK